MKRIFRITLKSIAALVALMLVLLVALSLLLTPARLTRMVNKYANEYLNAEVQIGRASLKLFRSLPNLCIKVEDGIILSKAFEHLPDSIRSGIPASADTLARFGEIYLSLNIPDAIAGKYTVKRVMAAGLKAYAYVAPEGSANWEIWQQSGEPQQVEESDSAEPLRLDIREIEIADGIDLTLKSIADSIDAHIGISKLLVRGNISTIPERIALNESEIEAMDASLAITKMRPNSITTKFSLDTMQIHSARRRGTTLRIATRTSLNLNGERIVENMPVGLRGTVKRVRGEKNVIAIESLALNAGIIPIEMEGSLKITDSAVEIPGLKGRSRGIDIGAILSRIPERTFPSIKELETDATLLVGVEASGKYDFESGELPSLKITASVPPCRASFRSLGMEINNISAEVEADYRAAEPQQSRISLKRLTANGKAIRLNGECSIADYLNDPLINLNLSAYINADSLSKLLPPDFPAKVTGKASAKMGLNTRLSNLTDMGKIGAAKSSLEIKSNSAEVLVPDSGILCRLLGTSLSASTGKRPINRDKTLYDSLLMLSFSADSSYIKYNEEMELSGKAINISTRNSAKFLDNKAKNIIPLVVRLGAERLVANGLGDNDIRIRMRNTKNTISIMPDRVQKRNPRLRLKSTNESLRMKDMDGMYSIRNAELNIKATMDLVAEAARKTRRTKLLDSLQGLYPNVAKDSLVRHHLHTLRASGESTRWSRRESRVDELSGHDLQMRLSRNLTGLISDLNIEGTLKAERGRITTPLLPLRITLNDADIAFNSDSLNIHNTLFRIGESQLRGNGYLAGLRGALTRNSTIIADMDLIADTLNLNQLLVAVEKGQQYLEEAEEQRQRIASMDEAELEERIESAVESDVELPSQRTLFIIPGNLKARLDVELNHALYARTIFEQMSCSVRILERCLQLKNFRAASSSGSIALSAFYSTKSRSNISAGLDMDLANIEVADFIDMIPSVDTLLPMLKSFEGHINSQIAFSSNMDDKMNLDPLSMQGSMRIKGDSLVLMDGETFAKIAKKARFKNRARNLVDSISVEALVHDGFIELFPFIISMDRYTAAVSGRQNLDMSYNYHISVLKSIIPFRFGINIRGDKDKMRFGIGRAKYKSAKLPVYSFIIDNAKMNLRDYISRIYTRGVEIAANSPINKEALLGEVEAVEKSSKESSLVDDFGDGLADAPVSVRDSIFMAEPDSVLVQMQGLTPQQQDSLLLKIKYREAMESIEQNLGTLPASKAKGIRKRVKSAAI